MAIDRFSEPKPMTRDLVVFDTWASYAFFRKSGTTTTSLTYPFMPRSAAEGFIGAIIGLDFEKRPAKLAQSKIAIGVRSPVSKLPFSVTYTDTKEIWPKFSGIIKGTKSSRKVEFRTRVRMELLRDPRYRIYFDDSDDTKEILERRLRNHETTFTPYLGSSSMIANFEYVGRYPYEREKAINSTPIASVVPFSRIMPIEVEKDVAFAVEQSIPIHLTSERNLIGTYNAIYSPSGTELKVRDIEVQEIKMEGSKSHIVFVPTEITPR
jgi:CRISPR-associated protein Cas5h